MLKFGQIKTMQIVSLLALFLPVLTCSCPDGWGDLPSRNCYYIGSDLNSFLQADRQCRNLSKNANLISIHNAFDNQLIKDELIKNPTIAELWIGLENLAGNLYEWIDGSLTTYVQWCPGFPNGSNNHCVKFTRPGCWVNADCSDLSAFVCGTLGGEEQLQATTTTVTGTSPTTTEGIRRPFNLKKSCCLVAEPCNAGFTLMEDGWCYYASNYSVPFVEASSDCRSRGAELVSMHSFWENVIAMKFALYAHEVLHRQAHGAIWIGLQCDNSSVSSCNWTDGSLFHFFTAHSFYFHVDYSGVMSIEAVVRGRWASFPKNQPLPFICKYRSAAGISETADDQLPHCNIGYWPVDGNTSCYGFESADQMSWDYCDAFCIQTDGRCASIHSQQQNDDLYELFRTTQPPADLSKGYHLGLKEKGDFWNWVDGTPYNVRFWTSGYPISGQTPYVNISTNGSWATDLNTFRSHACTQKQFDQLTNNVCPRDTYFGMGEIRSPGYPNNYFTNLTCTYTLYDRITADPPYPSDTEMRTKLALYFITFNTHLQDVVEIFDGPNMNFPLIANISGMDGAKREYYSTGYSMTIQFTPQYGNVNKGWRAVFGPYTTRP